MHDLSFCKLYNLNINNFYSKGFFFFLVFSLDRDDFFNLYTKNIKVTYLNKDLEYFGINKENKVYVIYDYQKFEIYSLPLIYSRFYNVNKNAEVLNTCLVYSSILYNELYYSSNIRFVYKNIIHFHRKNIILFLSLIKKINIFYINMDYMKNFLVLCSIKKILLYSFFTKRFSVPN